MHNMQSRWLSVWTALGSPFHIFEAVGARGRCFEMLEHGYIKKMKDVRCVY